MTTHRSRSLVISLTVGVSVLLASAISLTLRWIDKQDIPVASNARIALRFIAATYPLLPGNCEGKCVARAVKIANLLALSEQGKKSLVDLAKDMGSGYYLLNTVLNKESFADRTAEFELALERLLFSNRVKAMAIILGARFEGSGILEKALSLQDHAYDEETKAVLQREAFIFRAMQGQDGHVPVIGSPEHASGPSFPAAYQLMASGWALCAIRDDRGAEYIKRATPYLFGKRQALIHAIARNLDTPLIAAAEMNGACQSHIDELKALLIN